MIDPGHGGKDPGALSRNGYQEKVVNLDVAKRVRKILEENGVKVIMTRDKDEFITLPERTEIASRSRADLFVSIHANSSPARSVFGLETYWLRELSAQDKKEDQRVDNHRLMFKHLAMRKDSKDLDQMLSEMMYLYKQSEAQAFASSAAKNVTELTRTKNLGRKQARFFVLRNTLIPAVLVEVGFMTNRREEKNLKLTAYRQKIAEGLAKTILDYLNGH